MAIKNATKQQKPSQPKETTKQELARLRAAVQAQAHHFMGYWSLDSLLVEVPPRLPIGDGRYGRYASGFKGIAVKHLSTFEEFVDSMIRDIHKRRPDLEAELLKQGKTVEFASELIGDVCGEHELGGLIERAKYCRETITKFDADAGSDSLAAEIYEHFVEWFTFIVSGSDNRAAELWAVYRRDPITKEDEHRYQMSERFAKWRKAHGM